MPPNPTPKGDDLIARIQRLENLLGVNGSGSTAFKSDRQRTQVQPTSVAFNFNSLSTSSTSPVALVGSPVVTVTIGASGDAIVEVGSNISSAGAGQGGIVYILVDGTRYSQFVLENLNQVNSSCYVSFLISQLFGKLTPGLHTFTLEYAVNNPGTAVFFANVLKVQPL